MFFAELVCLFISLFYVWFYIVKGVHTKAHRLLPLILGLVALYNFYELVELITGNSEMIAFLEDLLFVQLSYLFLCYLLDFLSAKIPILVHILLFALLAYANVSLFTHEPGTIEYFYTVVHYSLSCITMSIILIVWVFIRSSYNKRKMIVDGLFSISVMFPVAVYLADKELGKDPGLFLMISFIVIFGGVSILLSMGLIVETENVLEGRIFQELDMPIMLFDNEKKFISANNKAKDIYPELRQGRLAMLRIRKQKLGLPFEISKKYNGMEEEINKRFYTWSIDAVYENEKLRGFIVQLIDITNTRNEAERMKSLKQAAEEQSIVKAQFLANTSHELRSPLHAIIGIGEIISARQDIAYKDRRMVANIVESGNSLLKLVNAILDFSKLEAGQYKLSQRPFDINNILGELTQMAVINLERKPIDFSIEIKTQYPELIIGDELAIRNMIQNLITNAIKFTTEGSIICVLEFFMEEDSLQMSCSTKDTGAGMTKDVINNIFDEYTSHAGEHSMEGTGLGLSNVRMLSHLMDGDVWANSDGFSGSTVGFYVNMKYDVSAGLREPVTFDKNTDTTVIKNTVLPDYIYPYANVLVTDDMRINRQIFSEVTAGWKFQISEAEDGDEAVELVKNNQYDLIFLDLKMPRMPGDVAIKEIKKYTDTPVILLSANLLEDVKEDYYAMGFARILTKPLDMFEVKSAIEELMPKEKRLAAGDDLFKSKDENNRKQLESKFRTYKTFEGEILTMTDCLMEEYHKSLDLFQTRVHGIKGAARQLGFEYMANQSEIMEMAAKAGHTMYIDNNIDQYIEDMIQGVEEVVKYKEDVEDKLNKLIAAENKTLLVNDKVSLDSEEAAQRIGSLFKELHSAFLSYKMDAIEDTIGMLQSMPLDDMQKEKLSKAKEAMEDFDYELGAEILEDE